MELLAKEGYLLEDLIDATANWVHENVKSSDVVKDLESAVMELRRIRMETK